MKFILNVTLPHHTFNAAVKDGSAGGKIKRIVEATKPESIYFFEVNHKRGATVVVNMNNASELPGLVEPWMLLFDADIEFKPIMSLEDLMHANLDQMGKTWA